ncbi:hypothetical protein CSE16_09425 [Solibacillus sp. R5-41]|uniref:hypothetical protein n=1 Tax=Solibacillus sp. R5-41 TaxID=2048654 RepID=UPI000C12554D|nr:hypothetical protein [Solibacillus sp. R5-41]ATP40245.1 hypothetical protein CSE16_09425 [Solibacillus sp. R5-41]
MDIYSLSGPSGTGKSTSALQFAHDHQIQAIIDDGLLIVNGEKVAGTSAKFEKHVVTAVRRAIFDEEWHQAEVIQALRNVQIQSILIIGTSDKMTKRIAKRLELGDIQHYFYVEDVRSTKEIQMARFVREIQGKHVMPVPYKQVEQNFFKRLVQKGKEIFSPNREKLGETTIVRPDFHHQTITISHAVYTDIIKHVVANNPYVTRLNHLHFSIASVPTMRMDVSTLAPVNYYVPDILKQLQREIAQSFLFHFQVEPEDIHITLSNTESKKSH